MFGNKHQVIFSLTALLSGRVGKWASLKPPFISQRFSTWLRPARQGFSNDNLACQLRMIGTEIIVRAWCAGAC
jgi:hypothetical protein